MKAAIFREYEAPVEIAEVARPELQDGSVLIEVHAASLNPIDNILRAGYLRQMLELSFPHVKGYDVSGTVVEVGKDVKSVEVGDEVFARPNQMDAGAVAEFARIQEDELAIKPANITHEQAASVPLAGLTAWQALVTKGNIKEGDKVLMWYVSGNRDEEVIENPNAFIIDRAKARHHVSFGFGIHRCMGNRMAEMQLRIVWEEIMKRFRKVEVVGDIERTHSSFVKGYTRMPVRVYEW